MKKLLIITFVFVLLFSLSGCVEEVTTKVVESELAQNYIEKKGEEKIKENKEILKNVDEIDYGNEWIKISDNLAYDPKTKIVWVNTIGAVFDVVDTSLVTWNDWEPYIAPNGLPYRYNIETKMLEEIED